MSTPPADVFAGNYLVAWDRLVEHLQSMLVDDGVIKAVYPAIELNELVRTPPRLTPCVVVSYRGDALGEDDGTGGSQLIAQQYLVVVVVRNVSADPVAVQTEAGPIVTAVLRAVSGWAPGPEFGPLRRQPYTVEPFSAQDGYWFFPYLFTTAAEYSGADFPDPAYDEPPFYVYTKGETGEQGLPGEQGPQGEQGLKGDKGDTGNTGPPGTTDHGLLTGLSDDDHAHYHNDTRGDARYSLLGHTHDWTYSAKSALFTAGAADRSTFFYCSGTWTLTFDAPGTLGAGWFCGVKNSGTEIITLSHTSGNIDGLSSYLIYPGDTRFVQCDGSTLRTVLLAGGAYAWTSGVTTFTVPPGLTAISYDLIGGGGGGGSGRKGAGSSTRTGGAGGGGAGRNKWSLLGAEIPAAGTAVAVEVGAGGTAGTSVAVNGTSGNAGGAGGTSVFGSFYAYGGGGGGGGDGTTTTAGGGGGGGVNSAGGTGSASAGTAGIPGAGQGGLVAGIGGGQSTYAGAGGGASGSVAAANVGGGSTVSAGGGGGAGNITAANALSPPGAGGIAGIRQYGGGGAAAVAEGGNGTAGTTGVLDAGSGGGGGYSSKVGNAGTGGAGGAPGGGGGGGGAAVNDTGNSGAGGAGGQGKVWVEYR